MSHTCRICGQLDNTEIYFPTEMMFGLKDKFVYFKCSSCDCLQISEYPFNVSKYYGYDYHFKSQGKLLHKIKDYLIFKRDLYEMTGLSFIGKVVSLKIPQPGFRDLYDFLKNKNARILDVGCSTGRFLRCLKKLKFNNLFGVDLYIDSNISYDGINIFKGSVFEITDTYDVIILNHSLEHMPNQLDVISKLYRLLEPGGICIIRIPLSSSFAFDKYRENWVQLDAPRHFYLHSVESIKILIDQVGFNISKIVYDSTSFQFWGSDNYLRNIALKQTRFLYKLTSSLDFSRIYKKYFYYKNLAKKLNLECQGDQATFFIIKK
jgi:SAM-dependent methyltransferase